MLNVTNPQDVSPSPVGFALPSSSPQRMHRCDVMVVSPEANDRFADDLLPWADPYIASLIASLQREEAVS